MTTTIELGPRDLLVVAGLPGAGKTTMLATLPLGTVPVLDSDQVRALLRARLPAAAPYRCYRPLVHAWHRLRIVGHAAGARGPVVVHEPSTRASTRLLLALVAMLTGRPVRMLWLDASPDQALAGQRDRGRVVRQRSFGRHVRRADRVRVALRDGWVPRGWRSAVTVTRESEVRMALVTRAQVSGTVRSGRNLS